MKPRDAALQLDSEGTKGVSSVRHFVALLSFLLLLGLAADASLRMVPSEIDAGVVIAGIQVQEEIVVLNEGDKSVGILGGHVTSSCFCECKTAFASAVAQSIPPQSRAAIKVVVDTSYLSGEVEEVIHLHTTDGDLSVKIRIEVIPAQPWQKSVSEVNSEWVVVVDVRNSEAYDAGHLVGAVSLPAEGEFALNAIPSDVFVLIYDEAEDRVPALLRTLYEKGFCHVWGLEGGIRRWQDVYGDELLVSMGGDPLPSREVAAATEPCSIASYSQMLSVQTLRRWQFILIDTRSFDLFQIQHLFGAISAPSSSTAPVLEWIPLDVPLVVYSATGEMDEAFVRELREAGYEAFGLLGGLAEWEKQLDDHLVVRMH